MIEVKSQEILLTVDGATLRVGVTYHTPMVMAELPEIRVEVVGGDPVVDLSGMLQAVGGDGDELSKPIYKPVAKRRRVPKKPIAKSVEVDADPSRMPRDDRPYKNYDWLFAAYVTDKRTREEIADQCGVSIQTIRNWLKKFGIKRPRHPRGEGNIV